MNATEMTFPMGESSLTLSPPYPHLSQPCVSIFVHPSCRAAPPHTQSLVSKFTFFLLSSFNTWQGYPNLDFGTYIDFSLEINAR